MPKLVPRLRIMQGAVVILGPGKADLLDAIRRHGSLRDAAAELEMSYMRAWNLVRIMNAGFRQPLVTLRRGGTIHGSAELSETGRAVLRLYRAMESDSRKATRIPWQALRKLVR